VLSGSDRMADRNVVPENPCWKLMAEHASSTAAAFSWTSRLNCAPASRWPIIQGEQLIPERGIEFPIIEMFRAVIAKSDSSRLVPFGQGGCIHEVGPDA
jgi:hypothetical protein